MYCERYDLGNITAKSEGKIIFHDLEFNLYDNKENFLEIGNQNIQCFVYV